jgi:tetratricopeptide (TPR) repeat protein
MKTIIVITAFLVSSLLCGQTQFEQGMEKAFSLWGEGKTTEATALFERIASAEKNNWLPNYYIGLINTTEAFNPKNKDKVNSLVEKAQDAIDNATLISPNNAEIMVIQALIYTVILVQDPMTNGMKYSALAMEQYNKALAIDPNNPRVVFGKAEFELGGAKWSGVDTKPICNQIAKSLELFATFKPETAFYPKWGEERAKEVFKNCK